MIKIHPEFHAHPMDGAGYGDAFAFASEHRIPVLTHSWGVGRGLDHPDLARGIAERYPGMPFILGHAGGVPEGVHAAVAVAREAPSVLLDTGTSQVLRGAIEHMVEEVGADRVLFGTDAAYLADAPQVARIAGARIDEADKRKILGENLLGLLRAATAGPGADLWP
jgi:predicted TIM-barrel fold metal-dependent hydrolase